MDNPHDQTSPRDSSLSLTHIIVGVNTALFLLTHFTGPGGTPDRAGQLLAWGANFGPLTLSTQPWRLLAANYLHFGWVHFLTNMICLWGLGRQAEALFPKRDFFLLYTVTGIAGSLFGVYAHPLSVGAGASGAIFGLAGALLTTLRWGHLPLPDRIRRNAYKAVVEFAGLNLLLGLSLGLFLNIDNYAHIGGFLSGGVIGLVMGKRLDPSERSRRYRQAAWLGVLLALTGVGGLVYRAGARVTPLYRAEESLKRGEADAVLKAMAEYTREYATDGKGYILQARAYLLKGDHRAAADALQKASDLSPGDEALMGQLAYALERAGRHPAAEVVRRRLLDADRGDLERYLALAETQLAQHKVEAAETTMRSAQQYQKRDLFREPALHLMLARIAFEREDLPGTIKELDEAGRLGAPAQVILPAKWQVYRAMGDTARADAMRKEMEKAAAKRP
jgi:rhomboid protease GluP